MTLLGSGAAAATCAFRPLAARAQQTAKPLIGFLNSASRNEFAANLAAFHQGLGGAGYAEGRNVAIEYRWAEGQYGKLPGLAADSSAVRWQCLVAPAGLVASLAAKGATSTIPIVFAVGSDPVKYRLVASLSRPGGNVTGASFLINELVPKQLDVLNQLLPAAKVIGLLANPDNPNTESTRKRSGRPRAAWDCGSSFSAPAPQATSRPRLPGSRRRA